MRRSTSGGNASQYEILIDGERAAKVASPEAVRSWMETYRDQHEEDDPGGAHVQILARGRLSWMTGGKLVDRENFL
jgi:hypothetical protein